METQPIQTQQATRASNEHRITGVALISVLIALMLTLLLEALDQTVVGTALPKIIGELQGFDRYTWAITAYTLGSTIMIPIVGKLSDQFGRKWFLVSGTIIFLLGSALSGRLANHEPTDRLQGTTRSGGRHGYCPGLRCDRGSLHPC